MMVYRSVYNDLVQAWYNSSSHAVVIVVAKEKGLEVVHTNVVCVEHLNIRLNVHI